MSDAKTIRTDHPTPDKPLPAKNTYRYTAEDQRQMSNRDGTITMRVQVGVPTIVDDRSNNGKNWLNRQERRREL